MKHLIVVNFLFACFLGSGASAPTCISNRNFILFGDDYSAIDSQTAAPWNFVYRRRSNGKLWPEYAQQSMSIVGATLNNYAWAGATAFQPSSWYMDMKNYSPVLLEDEVKNFLATNPGGLKPADCVLMWIGMKDLWNYWDSKCNNLYSIATQCTIPDSFMDDVVFAIKASIRVLKQNSATCFVIGNVFDLALLPDFQLAASYFYGSTAKAIGLRYNDKLQSMISSLRTEFGSQVYLRILDMTAVLKAANPESSSTKCIPYGFAQYDTPYYCPKNEFWLDKLYLTTVGHSAVSSALLNELCAGADPLPNIQPIASSSPSPVPSASPKPVPVPSAQPSPVSLPSTNRAGNQHAQAWAWILVGVTTGILLLAST